jgi:hypothetical protein
VSRLDQPRFLAPIGGYTRRTTIAIDKLEAVSEDEQARLTQRAHRTADQQLRRRWQETQRRSQRHSTASPQLRHRR